MRQLSSRWLVVLLGCLLVPEKGATHGLSPPVKLECSQYDIYIVRVTLKSSKTSKLYLLSKGNLVYFFLHRQKLDGTNL
jgi:hypothetical protein